jgi:cytoskeletal protein CcmA (bactofilin family)
MWDKKDINKADDYGAGAGSPPSMEGGKLVNIGKSILIKGELSGNEDLSIDGTVEGKVSLKDHNLTIGAHGRLQAELVAKKVTILGEVHGNVVASEKVEIQEGGRLEGDITSPRLSISDGAHFRGKVDMERAAPAKATTQRRVEPRAAAAPGAVAGA